MLFGQSDKHLTPFCDDVQVHLGVVAPLRELVDQAAGAGIALAVASGFRSFDRQLAIWNAKAEGLRPVLDQDSRPIPAGSLSETELMWAILRWSALPGASRHHWGTDMDVWDKAAVDDDYRLQLTGAEYAPGGPFHPLNEWLGQNTGLADAGFFRPYGTDSGGVMPEPWHISYRPLAEEFTQQLSVDSLVAVLRQSDIRLKACILENIEEIMDRYVRVPG